MEGPDLGWLIERAISWETAAAELYLGLAELFSSPPEVAEFWELMSRDERLHARLLATLRDSLPAERLAEPLSRADLESVGSVEQLLETVSAARLDTLDDAHDIAHDLESSEVNTIFSLVMRSAVDSAARRTLIAAQLDEHVGRLTEFGATFDAEMRRSILPAE